MQHETTTTTLSLAARAAAALALLALLVAPPSAQAQGAEAFDYSRFAPQPAQGHDVLNVSTGDLVRHLGLSFGLFATFEDDPLTVVDDADRKRVLSRPIDHRLVGELHVTLGLFDVVSLGVAMPVTLLQSGDDLELLGRPGQVVDGVAPGDLRVVPKVLLVDPEHAGGFGLHVAAPIAIPIGDEDSFASDGGAGVTPTLGLDLRVDGGHLFALNVGYRLRPIRRAYNYVSGPALVWAFGARAAVIDELAVVASVFGAVDMEKSKDPIDFVTDVDATGHTVEALGGLEVRPVEGLVLTLGAGGALVRGVGSPDVRAWLGVAYALPEGVADSDGDGIPDDVDRCPDAPEDVDGFEDDDGCPDPDNDGDGIPDAVDACPDEAEDVDGFEDEDGCPDPDNDGDGIPDDRDACPDEAEDIDGFEDDDGCPDPDNDGDGLCDPWVAERGLGAKYAGVCKGVDQCPDAAEDVDGLQDDDGCPEDDADGDGIPDERDKCPLLPETVNGYKDADGCPDVKHPLVELTRDAIVTKRAIMFGGDERVLPGSYGLLDVVAQVLVDNPFITKLSVEAHTDSAGPDDFNLDLSRRRAAEVVALLVERGVAAERLVSDGFGESRPIAPNTTPYGRAKNRRVEFRIIGVLGEPVVAPDPPK